MMTEQAKHLVVKQANATIDAAGDIRVLSVKRGVVTLDVMGEKLYLLAGDSVTLNMKIKLDV